jgi:translation elongation factor EF-1alpha
MAEREVGKVSHYFSNIGVVVIELSDALKVGDRIHVQGATSDFEQDVSSMQIEHEQVQEAGAGDAVGLKVDEKARDGDKVFVVEP